MEVLVMVVALALVRVLRQEVDLVEGLEEEEVED